MKNNIEKPPAEWRERRLAKMAAEFAKRADKRKIAAATAIAYLKTESVEHAQHGCPPDCTCNSYPGCGHKDCLVAWVETGKGVCLRGGE